MPRTHSAGSFFAHAMQYPTRKFPLVDRGITQEIEHPFRVAASWVVRVPFTRRAFVLGRWGPTQSESVALSRAIKAREMGRYSEWDG